MTSNECKQLKYLAKPFVDNGQISLSAMQEIEALLKNADSKPARPDLITRQEAMKILGVSTQTMRNWEKDKTITPIKLAGKRLVRYHAMDITTSLLETPKVLPKGV